LLFTIQNLHLLVQCHVASVVHTVTSSFRFLPSHEVLSHDRVIIDGFGLVIWFIDHLQIVTTSDYNILTCLHTLKVTVTAAHIVFCVFNSRLLVMDLNAVLCLCPYCLAHTPQLFFFFYYWWGDTKSLGTAKSLSTAATSGLLYKPQMTDEDDFWSNWWNEDWQGKPKYLEKTCPSATLSTTKSHMTRPRLQPWTATVESQRLTAWAMVRPYHNWTKL
jgi:hypothetical protein